MVNVNLSKYTSATWLGVLARDYWKCMLGNCVLGHTTQMFVSQVFRQWYNSVQMQDCSGCESVEEKH